MAFIVTDLTHVYEHKSCSMINCLMTELMGIFIDRAVVLRSYSYSGIRFKWEELAKKANTIGKVQREISERERERVSHSHFFPSSRPSLGPGGVIIAC